MSYCADMVDSKFQVKTENFGKVHQSLENYGYILDTDDGGNIIGLEFNGGKVAYDEEEMFQKIAPFVEDGSFIEMQGEDGIRWRWIFSSGKVREVKSKIVWDDNDE